MEPWVSSAMTGTVSPTQHIGGQLIIPATHRHPNLRLYNPQLHPPTSLHPRRCKILRLVYSELALRSHGSWKRGPSIQLGCHKLVSSPCGVIAGMLNANGEFLDHSRVTLAFHGLFCFLQRFEIVVSCNHYFSVLVL